MTAVAVLNPVKISGIPPTRPSRCRHLISSRYYHQLAPGQALFQDLLGALASKWPTAVRYVIPARSCPACGAELSHILRSQNPAKSQQALDKSDASITPPSALTLLCFTPTRISPSDSVTATPRSPILVRYPIIASLTYWMERHRRTYTSPYVL